MKRISRVLFLLILVTNSLFIKAQNFPDLFGLYPAPNEIVRVPVDKSSSVNYKVLSVPKYLWVYGCTPTALGMLVAYYDNNGFPNLYDGEAPMTNCEWDCSGNMGEHPMIATKKGLAGRTNYGHVDDY